MPRVGSSVSLEWFTVLSNVSAKHWGTYHSWTALSPVGGLMHTRVNSWVGGNSAEMKEAGTGAIFIIMLCNYSLLLPVMLHLQRGEIQLSACGCVSSSQVTQCQVGTSLLSCFIISLRVDSAGSFANWLVRFCPSRDLKTAFFPDWQHHHIVFVSLVRGFIVWPAGEESASNYLAIQWERAPQHFASDLVKLRVWNKASSTNKRSGLIKVGQFIHAKSHGFRLWCKPTIQGLTISELSEPSQSNKSLFLPN